jgi:hypothetical protein
MTERRAGRFAISSEERERLRLQIATMKSTLQGLEAEQAKRQKPDADPGPDPRVDAPSTTADRWRSRA